MDTQQKTLDFFIKSRKRPTNDDGIIRKKGVVNNIVGNSKPSRKLSFDDSSAQQTIKKQKVSL